MFARRHREHRRRRVLMIGDGDANRVHRLLLLNHLPVVPVTARARKALSHGAQIVGIHVAQRHDILLCPGPAGRVHARQFMDIVIRPPAATGSDTPDVELLVG